MNTPTHAPIESQQKGISIVPERLYAQVLIQFLKGEKGDGQNTIDSAIQYFARATDFLIFGQEVRAHILEKGDGQNLLDGAIKLPENLAVIIRSRVANAIQSISLHSQDNTH